MLSNPGCVHTGLGTLLEWYHASVSAPLKETWGKNQPLWLPIFLAIPVTISLNVFISILITTMMGFITTFSYMYFDHTHPHHPLLSPSHPTDSLPSTFKSFHVCDPMGFSRLLTDAWVTCYSQSHGNTSSAFPSEENVSPPSATVHPFLGKGWAVQVMLSSITSCHMDRYFLSTHRDFSIHACEDGPSTCDSAHLPLQPKVSFFGGQFIPESC